MPTADTKPRTNRRRNTRQKFTWLDQVKADKKLPGSAFLVAFELKQGFNADYGGACWKSIETLADETGLSEPSIVRITRQLVQHGHLRIEPGKAGRGGHTNRYFMVKKTSADGGSQTSVQTSAGESQTSAGGGDLLKTHLRGEAKASPLRGRENGSRALTVIPASAPAPVGGAPEESKEAVDGFSDLWALWSSHRNFPDTDEDAALGWKAYIAIVPGEVSRSELHSRAGAHIAGVKANGLKVGDLWKWLGWNNWRKEPPPSPQPQRNGKDRLARGLREFRSQWGLS